MWELLQIKILQMNFEMWELLQIKILQMNFDNVGTTADQDFADEL
ncbi:hypothetical protein LEP1GSC021_0118 [Leptospira noguchii str. 1993005606]|nr:hypothetical protein LEP1GSC021_0118 [Leptospira noguchii str. 1993005606]